MPKFLEDRLKAEAAKKGFTGKRADRYVFGGLNNLGVMHGSKETAKGEREEAKHEAKLRSEVHEYDSRRPKKPIVSRYR